MNSALVYLCFIHLAAGMFAASALIFGSLILQVKNGAITINK